MTDRYSEDDVVASVTRLTRSQLVTFIECDFVRPEREAGAYVFRRIDLARLELLCDLSQDLDLDEIGLGIVISLIDQLHAARQDIAAMSRAIGALPADLQERIVTEMKKS